MARQVLSVLISVYAQDDPGHFDEALRSLWDAQAERPGEIVLVLDGPLGGALQAVVRRWRERLGDRLQVLPLPSNQGLAKALNHGLAHCRHELVARADADDVSLPGRLARQRAFMAAHPAVAASSTWVQEFDETMQRPLGIRSVPPAMAELLAFSKLRSPLNHPSAIFRRDVVAAVGGYPALHSTQDYGLWSLLLQRGFGLANIAEVHVHMRAGESFLRRRGAAYLKGERELLRFQYAIGFLSRAEYARSLLLRAGMRHAPAFLRKGLYALVRR